MIQVVLWHRHYDPSLGRYTQPDPLSLMDGPSRCAYARNNSTQLVDPTGEAVPLAMAADAAAGAVAIIAYKHFLDQNPDFGEQCRTIALAPIQNFSEQAMIRTI